MRLRLTLTLHLERTQRATTPEPPHTIESQGSLIETSPQPRYIGFQPEDRT